jgi:dTDP-glucose 4,6-dehydratase
MKVLITGVAGFIGSNLAAAHLNQGDEVVGVDNFSTGKRTNLDNLQRLEIVEGDIVDVVPELATDFNVVYHFASPASPEKYMAMAMNTMEVNTSGTLNLLKFCSETDARLVFASTSEVYGDPLVSPQAEDYWGNVNPIGPRSVYDEAKRFGETLVAHFQREKAVNAGIIRIFNTYGPNMDAFDGRVVSTFVRQALLGEPLTVFGDGTQTRSFCYIDDLVAGIQMMGKSEARGPINLGNPSERTLLQLAEIVLEVTGSKSNLVFTTLPEDDPKQRCPDISRARAELGWEPVVDIRPGIERTAAWIKTSLPAT